MTEDTILMELMQQMMKQGGKHTVDFDKLKAMAKSCHHYYTRGLSDGANAVVKHLQQGDITMEEE